MAQPPFLLDVLQIEPGSGDTLTISRDSTAGGMEFVDAVLTSGALLQNLVGIRNITGVYVVGRGGDGAAYTTIQAALDALPASSSATNPSLILVMPGVYTENITIQKDGVYIVGLGGVTISNSGVADTITVAASTTVIPQNILLKGLRVTNNQAARSCVLCLGANSFATGTVQVDTIGWSVGDTVTIGGVPLTAVAGTRTSGSDDFSISVGTTDAQAAEIAEALNDSANSFASTVSASSALNEVTITAVTAGSAGNTITLAASVTAPGGATLSGATLSGGGSAGSTVLDGQLLVDGCELVASGAGGFQLNAGTCGHLYVRGGSARGSATDSKIAVANCAAVSIIGVDELAHIETSYDTTLDRPNDTNCEYEFSGTNFTGDLVSDLAGAGSIAFRGCTVGDVGLAGDRTATFDGCKIGGVTLNEAVAVTLRNGERGALTLGGGAPTLAESRSSGSEAFAASVSQTVSFTIAQPDANYTVLLENPQSANVLSVQNKLAASFDIVPAGAITGTVGYVIFRDL